jgi:hypothetical protein
MNCHLHSTFVFVGRSDKMTLLKVLQMCRNLLSKHQFREVGFHESDTSFLLDFESDSLLGQIEFWKANDVFFRVTGASYGTHSIESHREIENYGDLERYLESMMEGDAIKEI